jgi:hypothetical protein
LGNELSSNQSQNSIHKSDLPLNVKYHELNLRYPFNAGVSHFSGLKTASQRENIQKISENAIAGWVIVMESIPTYASR